MNTTGRAKGPGPHRTSCEGNPKSEEWCGKPEGLHGPLLLGCCQGLALQGSSANEGRFRQVRPSGTHKGQTLQPRPFHQTLLSPASARGSRHCLPRPPHHARQRRVGSQEAAPSPSPSSAMRYGLALGQIRKLAPAGGQGLPSSLGTLSARAARGLARPDSRRRPPRSPRPWRSSAHRGRCRAA